jgi:GH15 family glucan-1,4-alpha-glucosidase
VELRVFHPLLADAVSFGLLIPDSPEAAFALDIVERSFAIEDTLLLYNARPDGDWFERQARPLLTLQLAAAYATCARLDRAEALFGAATDIALRYHGLLPELIDPLGGSQHGATPSTVAAAAYILTAERIVQARLRLR